MSYPDEDQVSLLRSQIEMLIAERENLLRVVGAAAAFVAELDSKTLPEDTYEAAELLAESLNDLPEDSLRDALERVKATMSADRDLSAQHG
ncbi:MAG: hypothetical protein M3Q32_12545 [Pseudomonadota bacterium]|nr:hypothetical protein [Burkholderiales bacterium]MDQ3197154.1 hypothetical protein [Pseudomonadota bacterium]